jgi:hypothetical protein
MRCPFCQTVMQLGKTNLEQSDGGAFLDLLGAVTGNVGSIARHLYFHQSAGGEAVYVDNSGQAFYCVACRALVLAAPGLTAAPEKEQQGLGNLPRYPGR